MSHYCFDSMMPEDIIEILKMLQAEKMAIVLVSNELMILRQTAAAARLLDAKVFNSIEGILSGNVCCAIRLCIDNKAEQTVTESLDDSHYTVKIHPVDDGVILYFSLIDPLKNTALQLTLDQNQKMRDSLTLILIAVSNLKRQPVDERGASYIGIVKQNSLRLLRDLDHIHALCSPFYQDEMKFCTGSIYDFLYKICEDIRCFFPNKDIQISLDCPNNLTAVFDPTQMSVAVYNLICNSLKYGGTDVEIIIRAELKNKSIYLSFTDNGPGIPEDALERSFNDYSDFDYSNMIADESQMCGLGIPLARRIAACHAGVLFISSSPSIGTTVTIAFPSNLIEDNCLNQSDPCFTSNGFNVAEIELSPYLSYSFYK